MIDQIKSARSVFVEIVEKVPHEKWAEFLDQACGEDDELRTEVQRLLKAHEEVGSFMERPAADPFTIDSPIAERAGTVIGPYNLLQQIGEGGFGVVFLAEQDRPVKRRVALKVIKPGMDTREVIARFEAERQALAMMDHPNIAKVHDAGATENGRPYFVMELVQGVSITDYCDQCNLTTRQRLELFVTVCQAVQHAHQKGIIHRDIKPTNVLVAIQDGKPSPKIIDFGVAKAIVQQLTEHTLLTAFAQMVGTPLYMSPEQAELSPLGVDTRSDIYSLGALLYELLTSTTPFDKGRLHAASYDALRRIIREEEPPRPSARISTLAADLATTVAEHRRTDARRLSQQVRGELDWIVMKCLDKDRNGRYETPNSLARDIEHYLHNEPVQACPPSMHYRLKKFVRRNKAAVLASAAVLVALMAGLIAASIGFIEARKQAQVARADSATSDLALALALDAEAKGNSKETERLARGGLVKRRELFSKDDPKVCSALHILAFVLRNSRPEEAISLERESIARRRKSQAPIDFGEYIEYPDLAPSLTNLAALLLRKGELVEAESLYREALPIWRKFLGYNHAKVANTLEDLASALSKQGKQAEAEECLRECAAIRKNGPGETHPGAITTANNLMNLLKESRKDEEANILSREIADDPRNN